MSGLDIVIVNWNTGRQLRACLASIAGATRRSFELRRVVIVDNASTDGSVDGLDSTGIPLELLRNPRNVGFAAACNLGAAGSSADYLLFLNPDTRLYPESLDRAVALMDLPENGTVGLAGIRLMDDSGAVAPSCSRFPTLRTLFSKSLGLYRLSSALFPSYALPADAQQEEGEVDYVMGAFFFVRRGVFEELGGFDERFFVYFEEADFARRMRSKGWTCRYYAGARAYHRGGGSSEGALAKRQFYAAASRILYARKHFGHAAAAAFLGSALTIEPAVRIIASLGARGRGSPRETARAYLMLYRALPRIMKGLNVGERAA